MYSVLKSYGLNGLNGFAVAVEADVSGGLPAFSLVGLPDSAVRESGDRVRSAVKNLGYKWPDRHITVNLAPADIRKSGPVYDLPLLLAVLASSGQMEEPPADAAFLGELALDGRTDRTAPPRTGSRKCRRSRRGGRRRDAGLPRTHSPGGRGCAAGPCAPLPCRAHPL